MATRWAVATGNWSNTATWDGGTLPTSADDVFADGKTVTIDQNVTVLSLRTTQRAGGTAGGGFTVSGAYTITCTGSGILAGTTTGLTCSNTAGTTVTIIGNVTGTASNGVNAAQCGGVLCNSTGTVNITGNLSSGAQGGYSAGVVLTGGTTLTVIGNATSVAGSASLGYNWGIYSNVAANVTVTGTVTGPSLGNTILSRGIELAANSTLTVTGSVNAGSVSTGIFVNGGTGTVTVTGTLTANGSNTALNVNAATAVVTGPFISSTTGYLPLQATGVVRLSPISNNEYRFLKTVSGTSSLFSSDVTSGAPTANNVRLGTVYGGGTLTGTLAVPSPSYVALGVATDNTVGSLAYNSDSAIADYLWNKQTSALTTAGSIGERLKNAATVDTVGSQIAAFDGL